MNQPAIKFTEQWYRVTWTVEVPGQPATENRAFYNQEYLNTVMIPWFRKQRLEGARVSWYAQLVA